MPLPPDLSDADSQSAGAFAVGRGTTSKYAQYLGDYVGIYCGYATDSARRERVASGGVATTLLATALDDRLVDAVAVVRSDFSGGVIGHKLELVTDPNEVQKYGTSAYFNIPIERYWGEFERFNGKLAVCGLPCHMGQIKQRRQRTGLFQNLTLLISLFCGHNNEPELVRLVLDKAGIPESQVTGMGVDRTYLGGNVWFALKDGSRRPVPFRHFNVYRSLWFHAKQMCRYCDDHLGASADISIGDVFVPEYRQRAVKHCAVIARTEAGHQLLRSAINRKILTCEAVAPEIIYRAQKRVIVPSGDLKSRYYACRIAGFPAKYPKDGRLRVRSLLTYSLLNLNDRLSQTKLGAKLIAWIPRPFLYAYIATIKLIHHSLGAK